MELILKTSFDRWVEPEIDGSPIGVSFKLKYPSIEQGMEIERLEKKAFNVIIVDDPEQPGNKIAKLNDIDATEYLVLKRQYLKYVIEDWKGMKETNGEQVSDINCILKETPTGKELDADLWWSLVRDRNVADKLYHFFRKQLDYSNLDKKK